MSHEFHTSHSMTTLVFFVSFFSNIYTYLYVCIYVDDDDLAKSGQSRNKVASEREFYCCWWRGSGSGKMPKNMQLTNGFSASHHKAVSLPAFHRPRSCRSSEAGGAAEWRRQNSSPERRLFVSRRWHFHDSRRAACVSAKAAQDSVEMTDGLFPSTVNDGKYSVCAPPAPESVYLSKKPRVDAR